MDTGTRERSWVVMAISLTLLACGGDDGRRPLGATCASAAECASGVCAQGICLDPAGDDDGDGLSNGLELGVGTDVFAADSDGDGRSDADELDVDFAPRDADGDGTQDALESATGDADHDCVPDEADARNDTPDGATSPRLADLCPPAVGVCGAEGASRRVMCAAGLDAPACDFDEVPDYEATEASCDGRDNDCDDTVDEGCDPLSKDLVGHWELDGDGRDASVNGRDGTVVGAVAVADRFGRAAQAMYFSGDGDRVGSDATGHPLAAAAMTYSVWVRPDRGLDGELGVFAFGGDRQLAWTLAGARHCAALGAAPSPTACAPGGHWSHLVMVTGAAPRLYLDGRAQGPTASIERSDLDSSRLVIGAVGEAAFIGSIDDLRVWARALSEAEIQSLFTEGGWQSVGTAANPAQSCLHVRDAGALDATGGSPSTGSYRLDVDGDGERAAFDAYCDMALDGGGWTLAWVYGFTDYEHFTAVTNAVTPIPTWPAVGATVPVSVSAPASPTTPGAIDWALWRELGSSFVVVSDLNDGIACDAGAGSLVAGQDGDITCRTIVDTADACDGVVPTGIAFSDSGPVLRADAHYYYFDGSATEYWPTHDPCGLNSPQQVLDPARAGGSVYLRDVPD